MKFTKKFLQPSFLLSIIFILIIGFEVYLLYFKVYSSLSTDTSEVDTPADNIVRLNLTDYNTTLQMLDTNASYTPPARPGANPFQ